MRLAVVLAALVLAALAAPVAAETLTVGVFSPSAPFPSAAARVGLASALGDHLGKALGDRGVGRVYARAGDFAAAVKKGDVAVAVVDPAYLAATGGYTVIAAAVRAGDTNQAWQVLARGATKVSELRGKRLLVPANGGRESDFVLNVLFGGVERGFFAAIEPTPDTASALASLGLGKADAVVVPVGVELPAGATQVIALPAISTPVLVAYGAVTPARRSALVAAAASFKGDAAIAGFRAVDGDGVRAIARRFGAPTKRGPFVVPAVRLVVGELVEGRVFSIDRTPATAFATAK